MPTLTRCPECENLRREVSTLKLVLARASALARDASVNARRKVMEHATYHPETRTYTISELTLDRWNLR